MARNANRYGSDIGNGDIDDSRFLEHDYSIGGGVTMRRNDIDHGFPSYPTEDHKGKGPRNWNKSDKKIKDEICESLLRSPLVDATDVEVEVKNGEVRLKGWVNGREEKKEAERCAENTAGVDDVFNEIHLRNRKLQEGTSIAT